MALLFCFNLLAVVIVVVNFVTINKRYEGSVPGKNCSDPYKILSLGSFHSSLLFT